MGGPRAKKQRKNNAKLAELLGDSTISVASLRKLLGSLQGEAPSATYRATTQACAERLQHVLHVEPLVNKNGGAVEWSFCDPGRLLQYMVEICPKLQAIFAAAANCHRDSEFWAVVIEFDEFVPGNKLALNNRRKCMSMCFTFLELGRRFLSIPCVWMFPVVVRSSLYNSIDGGWSNFLRIFLKRMFLSANGFETAGVVLMLNNQPFLLKAKLRHLLSDGDGLRVSLNWRGASSLRPCWRHWNVLLKGSAIEEHSDQLVDVTCSDPRLFKRQDDASRSQDLALVEAAALRLEANRLTQTLHDKICMSRGLTYNRYGVLWDPCTRAMITQDVVIIDWVHSVLCDGSFSCEAHLVLESSERVVHKGFNHVESFLKDGWNLPAHRNTYKGVLYHIFDDIRHTYDDNHEKLKASASELLSVYGLLRHWVLLELQGADGMEKQVLSFNACCECIDILLQAKQGKLPMREAADLLERAATRHLEAHKDCYGTARIKPKHHWIFDIADQMRILKYILDAFLIEKEHLSAKACADRVENTRKFEQTVLRRMLHAQVCSLQKLGPQAELLGNSVPYPGFDDAFVSDNLAIEGVEYSVGDFVFFNAAPGRILACVQEGDDFFFVVQIFSLVGRRLSIHSANYTCQGERGVWNARHVNQALAWREVRPGVLTVLFC